MPHSLESPQSLKDVYDKPGCGDKLNGWTNDLNILSKPEPIAECETKLVNVSLKAQPQPQGTRSSIVHLLVCECVDLCPIFKSL